MPLGISQAMKDALATDAIEVAVLCKLSMPASAGGPRFFTDSGYPITYGGDTYAPSEDFLSATPPDRSKPRRLLQMVLNDDKAIWRTRFERSGHAVPVEFRALLVTNGVNEPLVTFKGIVDSFATGTESNGEPILTVVCTSLFVKLDSQPRNSTSRSFQRDVDSTDTSMDSSHIAYRAVRHKAAGAGS